MAPRLLKDMYMYKYLRVYTLSPIKISLYLLGAHQRMAPRLLEHGLAREAVLEVNDVQPICRVPRRDFSPADHLMVRRGGGVGGWGERGTVGGGGRGWESGA